MTIRLNVAQTVNGQWVEANTLIVGLSPSAEERLCRGGGADIVEGAALPPGLALTAAQVGALTGGIVAISANVTITTANQGDYDGKTLVWTGAYTVTLSAGLGNFGFIGETAASGNASIAFSGTTGINGATGTTAAGTTITRASQGFAVYARAADVYRVTGS